MQIEILRQRVSDFNALRLPGQPQAAHMGTVYLVNDLWNKIQELQAKLSAQQAVAADRATSDEIDTSAGGG